MPCSGTKIAATVAIRWGLVLAGRTNGLGMKAAMHNLFNGNHLNGYLFADVLSFQQIDFSPDA
jgi:hypothetical protein